MQYAILSAMTYTVDTTKIPDGWIRSFFEDESTEETLQTVIERAGAEEDVKKYVFAVVLDYVGGLVSFEDFIERLKTALNISDEMKVLDALEYIMNIWIRGIGASCPIGSQFYDDVETMEKMLEARDAENASEQKIDTSESVPNLPVDVFESVPDAKSSVEAEAPRDKKGEVARSAEGAIHQEVKTTEDDVVHFTQENAEEIAAHAEKTCDIETPDYACVANDIVRRISDEDQKSVLRDLIEKRVRGITEPYDFREKFAAKAKEFNIPETVSATYVSATELEFLKLHAQEEKKEEKSVLEEGANTSQKTQNIPVEQPYQIPAEKPELKEVVEEKKEETVQEKIAPLSVEKVNEEKEDTKEETESKKSEVKKDDLSKEFVKTLSKQEPVTILKGIDASMNPPTAGGGARSAEGTAQKDEEVEKEERIPHIARIPSWQEKLERDVKPPKNELLTPVDEIRTMTIAQWRRLGDTAKKRTERIAEKVQVLEERAYDKKIAGMKAWKQTDMYRQYVAIGEIVMRDGVPVPEAIATYSKEHPDADVITSDEWAAILQLNGRFRFV